MSWTAKLRRLFGGNEVYVDTVEGDIPPVPGLSTEEGQEAIKQFAGQAVRRAQETLDRAGISGLRRSSTAWCLEFGVEVIDPDGWDRSNLEESWMEPITLEEFIGRVMRSTVRTLGSLPYVGSQQGGGLMATYTEHLEPLAPVPAFALRQVEAENERLRAALLATGLSPSAVDAIADGEADSVVADD